MIFYISLDFCVRVLRSVNFEIDNFEFLYDFKTILRLDIIGLGDINLLFISLNFRARDL